MTQLERKTIEYMNIEMVVFYKYYQDVILVLCSVFYASLYEGNLMTNARNVRYLSVASDTKFRSSREV